MFKTWLCKLCLKMGLFGQKSITQKVLGLLSQNLIWMCLALPRYKFVQQNLIRSWLCKLDLNMGLFGQKSKTQKVHGPLSWNLVWRCLALPRYKFVQQNEIWSDHVYANKV